MIDPSNASELANIAQEIGAEVLEGNLTYPSDTGNWQLSEIDLSEYLARFRNKKVMVIIAPMGETDPDTFTCGICGFVMTELGECPRCKMQNDQNAKRWEQRALFDEVRDLLGGDE